MYVDVYVNCLSLFDANFDRIVLSPAARTYNSKGNSDAGRGNLCEDV